VLFIVSVIVSNLLFLMLIMKFIFLSEASPENYQKLGVAMIGYPFGSTSMIDILSDDSLVLPSGGHLHNV
jgi:hypothetical protein